MDTALRPHPTPSPVSMETAKPTKTVTITMVTAEHNRLESVAGRQVLASMCA